MYKIENDIPFPPEGHSGGRKSELSKTLEKLKPGQSILVTDRSQNNIYRTAHRILGKGNYGVAKDEKGWRIWRLKKE